MKKVLVISVGILIILSAPTIVNKIVSPIKREGKPLQAPLATTTIVTPQKNTVSAPPVVKKVAMPAHFIQKITPSSARRMDTVEIHGNGFFESDGYAFFIFEKSDGNLIEIFGKATTVNGVRVAKVTLKEPCSPGQRTVGTNTSLSWKCNFVGFDPGVYKVYSGIDANKTNSVQFTIVN